MMIRRQFIKTGIPGLDEICGGGFLRKSIITLSGPTGSGKSTLALQFLVEGALKYKEPGLYIMIEESRDSFLFHMSSYSWDLGAMEEERKLVLLDYPVFEVGQFLDSTAIEEIINSVAIERVAIDSITPIGMLFKDEDERKHGFMKLISNIRKWGTTTLLISEDTPMTSADFLPDTKYGLEKLTDGWVHLYSLYDHVKGERTRSLEVIKMKGAAHQNRIFPAKLGDTGFTLESGAKKQAVKPLPKPKEERRKE